MDNCEYNCYTPINWCQYRSYESCGMIFPIALLVLSTLLFYHIRSPSPQCQDILLTFFSLVPRICLGTQA
ncbi:MAG: hypothetical protein GDA43_01260 [Hormoscilla sp. SP5CHS1]|nr:hypothetical protein [Hormoscilla sp. SP5CHS1]